MIDLNAVIAEFLNQCGSCDAGLSMSCTCPTRDYRPTMLALVREIEDLRKIVDLVESSSGGIEDVDDWNDAVDLLDKYRGRR